MSVAKIGITIDNDVLRELDRLVARSRFPSRSRAIQVAVEEKAAAHEARPPGQGVGQAGPRC